MNAKFLHDKPCSPGGENSISRLLWTSGDHLCAILRVHQQSTNMTSQYQCSVRETSQIHCGEITILSQKRPPLAIMARLAIDNCFQSMCVFRANSVLEIKTLHRSTWVMIFVTHEAIWQWFTFVTSSLLKPIAESPHSLFALTHTLLYISSLVSSFKNYNANRNCSSQYPSDMFWLQWMAANLMSRMACLVINSRAVFTIVLCWE